MAKISVLILSLPPSQASRAALELNGATVKLSVLPKAGDFIEGDLQYGHAQVSYISHNINTGLITLVVK